MINPFRLNGIAWIVVLFLYYLGWSDLCIPLSPGVLVFTLFIIGTSFFLGYKYRNRFGFMKIMQTPHKSSALVLIFLLIYLVNFVCSPHLPLVAVMHGQAASSSGFHALPLFWIVEGCAMLYSFYLFYLFVCFHKFSLILQYFLVISIFALLYQRQYLVINFLGVICLSLGCAFRKHSHLSFFKKNIIVLASFIAVCIVLFFAGRMGNNRYGMWAADDSSMIMELGKINSKYPSWLPKEYSWTYIYIVTPLVNLQYNIQSGTVSSSNLLFSFLGEFITNAIGNKIGLNHDFVLLLVSSLTVGTAYANIGRISGLPGCYILYIFICILVIFVSHLYRKRTIINIPIWIGLDYFLLMSIFDNPIRFEMTSSMILIPVFLYLLRDLKICNKLMSRNLRSEYGYLTRYNNC